VWSAADGTEVGTLTPPAEEEKSPGALQGLAISPQGNLLAAGGNRGIVIWDYSTNPAKLKAAIPSQTTWRCLAFSPSGKILAVGSGKMRNKEGGSDGSLVLYDAVTGNPIPAFDAHSDLAGGARGAAHPSGRTSCLAFSPDGTILASGSADTEALVEGVKGLNASRSEVKLWETATGKKLAEFNPELKEILSLAFKPDGKTLLVAGGNPFPTMQNGAIKIYNVPAGTERGKLVSTAHQVRCFALSPNGKLAAWASHEAPTGASAGAILKRSRGEKVEPREMKSTLQLWNVN
jgi:WD40 repeat protein